MNNKKCCVINNYYYIIIFIYIKIGESAKWYFNLMLSGVVSISVKKLNFKPGLQSKNYHGECILTAQCHISALLEGWRVGTELRVYSINEECDAHIASDTVC